MPPGQLVHEPPPASDPKSESTDEEDDREEEEGLESVFYFSEYGQSEVEGQEPPEEVQVQEDKVAVRGHSGQGRCGEAECDRPDG